MRFKNANLKLSSTGNHKNALVLILITGILTAIFSTAMISFAISEESDNTGRLSGIDSTELDSDSIEVNDTTAPATIEESPTIEQSSLDTPTTSSKATTNKEIAILTAGIASLISMLIPLLKKLGINSLSSPLNALSRSFNNFSSAFNQKDNSPNAINQSATASQAEEAENARLEEARIRANQQRQQELADARAKKEAEERARAEQAAAQARAKKEEEARIRAEQAAAQARARKEEEARIRAEQAAAQAMARKEEEARIRAEQAAAQAQAKRNEEARIRAEREKAIADLERLSKTASDAIDKTLDSSTPIAPVAAAIAPATPTAPVVAEQKITPQYIVDELMKEYTLHGKTRKLYQWLDTDFDGNGMDGKITPKNFMKDFQDHCNEFGEFGNSGTYRDSKTSVINTMKYISKYYDAFKSIGDGGFKNEPNIRAIASDARFPTITLKELEK